MRSFFHPAQQGHRPQAYFSRGAMRIPQEIPERIDTLLGAVEKLGFEVTQPVDRGREPLQAVHDADYLDFLEQAHSDWTAHPEWGNEVISNIFVKSKGVPRGILAKAAHYQADGSCPIGPRTAEAAYWSAQGAVAAAAAVAIGEREAFALCRPPGHHARPAAAGGFCYINNAAVAAQELCKTFAKVAVLDTDMHHGQGTQEIFYDRDDVLFVSMHGDPVDFYPVVTGFAEERGTGAGTGHNLNIPMPHGSSEQLFFDALAAGVGAIETFGTEALVLSLGFDIYEFDPQSQVAFTTDGFRQLGKRIGSMELPTVITLEGGYHIESLAENATAFFEGFASVRNA